MNLIELFLYRCYLICCIKNQCFFEGNFNNFKVNFNAGSQSLGRNSGMDGRRGSRSQLSFSRKFPFVKSTEKLNEFTDNDRKSTT